MAGRLAGKTALITGAAQGIGRASAELFAKEGARVIATDLRPGACADVAGCEPRPLDVTDAPAVRALAEALGPIDVLFNCAGWVHAGTILDCDDDAWDRSFTINAKAMFHTIKAFLPGMIAEGWRLDRQHGVDRLERPRRAESLRLHRQQGGGRRAHQVGGARLHRQGHPL